MSRTRKSRMPHINNSGIDRSPDNVFVVIDDDPRGPFQVHFYEFELQELAVKFQDWNLFVKEEPSAWNTTEDQNAEKSSD